MKQIYKPLLLSLSLMITSQMQAQVIHFPMEVSADGLIQEEVAGQTNPVYGALAPVSVAGAHGKAWRLDGYSSYSHATINPAEIEGKSQLTFSLWVAPESYPMMRIDENGEWFTTLVGNLKVSDTNVVESGNKGFAFRLGSRGTYLFLAHVNGWKVSLQASDKLSRYQWNHLVVTIDGDNRKIAMYNNGELVASGKCQKGSMNGGDADLYIGKSAEDVKSGMFCLNTFNGIIDDFSVYAGIQDDVIAEKPENAPVFTYSPERYAADILRPAFHGMPSGAWTNETHGATYYNGKFHLFFQKNPNGPYMARLNWGHLVSDNLYQWEELPTAISPEEWYDQKGCWSGCVFTDDELTGGKPNLFYTGVDYARAMISQAQPQDEDLLCWGKMEKNPVVNGKPEGLSDDFRDCYLFRNGDQLYMIVGTSKNGIGATTLHRYDKSTGTWSNDGSIFFQGTSAVQHGTFWEMPNVTKIGDKWLFTVTPLNTNMGVHTLYWTGSILADGTFRPDSNTPKSLELSGFSKEGYGLLSPTIFQKDGKTLMLGIVPDKLPSEENFKLGYAHTYSLPREISLDANGNLVQKPYEGLKNMRSAASYNKKGFNLAGEQELSPVSGRSLELSGTFVVGNSDFGFTFFGDGSKQVRLSYSPITGKVKLDASGIDRIVQDAPYGGIYEGIIAKPAALGESVKLTVYVDHSIVDIFMNDTYAASVRLFPKDEAAVKASVFCEGEVEVKALDAYVLDATKISSGIAQVNQDKTASKVYASNGRLYYQLSADNCSIAVYDVAGTCVASHSGLSQQGSFHLDGHGVRIIKVYGSNHQMIGIYKVLL